VVAIAHRGHQDRARWSLPARRLTASIATRMVECDPHDGRDDQAQNRVLPASLAIAPLTCVFGAPRGIRTPNRQIRRLVLCVDLVGSRPIWPAHVECLVGPDGSRRIQTDRLDDQADDQAAGRRVLGHPDHGDRWWSGHQIFHLETAGGHHSGEHDTGLAAEGRLPASRRGRWADSTLPAGQTSCSVPSQEPHRAITQLTDHGGFGS
jgi:hypothetical protein